MERHTNAASEAVLMMQEEAEMQENSQALVKQVDCMVIDMIFIFFIRGGGQADFSAPCCIVMPHTF